MFIDTWEITISFYALLGFAFVILFAASFTLFKFVQTTPKVHRYGTLFALIVVYLAFGIIFTIQGCNQLIIIYTLTAYSFNFRSTKVINAWATMTAYFELFWVAIAGTLLALDRVLIMLFPFKYSIWKLGRKLFVFTVALCAAIYLPALVWFAVSIPSDDKRYLNINRHLNSLQVYVTLLETGLHVVFVLLYRKHSLSHALTEDDKQKANQMNQIILFLCVAQTVFCFVPILFREFIQLKLISALAVTLMQKPLFAVYVLLSCIFILFKLRRKPKTVSVVTSGTSTAAKSNRTQRRK